MIHPTFPLTRELVMIGGGHTHALVLRKWGMKPLPGVRLTLINPGPTAPYTGMLPGHVAGHYTRDDLLIDLVRLARFAGARLIFGEATGLDRERRHVQVSGRGPVGYDLVSINVGITSGLADLPGFSEHGIGAKPLGPYAKAWRGFRDAVRSGSVRPEIAIIGGGVGGIELSMAMAHALRQDGTLDAVVTVIERDTALPNMGDRARDAVLSNVNRLGVRLLEGVMPTAIDATGVTLADGTRIGAQFVVGAAGAQPQGWLAGTGLKLMDGFITVDPTLRSVSDTQVYAAGDCAHLGYAPRPKAGVFAVREAPVLYHNLVADLTGHARTKYRPQRDYLKLISLGGKSAVADKFGLRLEGRWLWRWKDRIDRRFMEKFIDLPKMPTARPPRVAALGVSKAMGDKPMCGGCGAKVGGGTLAGVLAQLPNAHRKDVLSKPGDDAAILVMGDRRQVLTTDHLRAFTEDPCMMARITAVHALGDIWAMGALPQAALATIILPRMTPDLQGDWLAEIMDAAGQVFADAGAEIVGGHTSLGAELTIGFSVTGLCEKPPITVQGAQPGDVLLLTKPIGSGTLLAGEMALLARGAWVEAALQTMAVPQGRAAAVLSDAHAMTDVTGFGLAGHLMAICDASKVAAELYIDAVPIMTGAAELAMQGVRSTLYPQNREMSARMTLADNPCTDLLFDPQTAGGLLAAVAERDAEKLLTQLRSEGYQAARIGVIVERAPFITVR